MSFSDSPFFSIAKNNARSHLMCLTRAAPAWFEWSELFKLFDWVEFFSKIIFRANGEKNNLKKFNEIKKFKKQAQLLNQAGAALVLHIKWWQALFFRCLNLASKKDGAFDILLLRCWFYLLRILNNAIFGLLFYWNLSKALQNTSTLPVFSIWFKFYPITWWQSVGFWDAGTNF